MPFSVTRSRSGRRRFFALSLSPSFVFKFAISLSFAFGGLAFFIGAAGQALGARVVGVTVVTALTRTFVPVAITGCGRRSGASDCGHQQRDQTKLPDSADRSFHPVAQPASYVSGAHEIPPVPRTVSCREAESRVTVQSLDRDLHRLEAAGRHPLASCLCAAVRSAPVCPPLVNLATMSPDTRWT